MAGVVLHEFSSPVADATGTITVGVFPNTSTVAASDLVQPSHWNSYHALAQALIGNVVGASSVSGTNIVLSAGNNITFSGIQGANIATVRIDGGAGGGGSLNVSAGSTSNNLTNLVFADGSGVTFGLDGSTITAAVRTNYAGTGTTFGGTNISGSITQNSDGIQLSLSGLAALTSQSNQNITAANGGFAFQTLSFSNTQGVSFATSAGSAIIGSVETSYVRPGFTSTTTAGTAIVGTLSTNGLSIGVPAFLTTARASNDAIGLNTAQSNVTWTVNSSGLSLDARGYVGTGTTFNGASISGSMTVNSVGVQLSMSVGAYLTSQSNQNVTAANGGFAFQTLSFSNLNGVSFGTSAGSAITASYTAAVVSNAIQSVGSATGSGTNTSRFAADDHVHAGVFSMGVSNLGNTDGNTRVDVGRFVFRGSDNVTISQVTAANALNTLIFLAGAGGGGTALTGYATSNTTVGTSFTAALSSLIFKGQGAASVGVSNGAVIIDAPNAAAGNVTFSAGTSSAGLASVVFSGKNGFSFDMNGSTISGGPLMQSYWNNGPQISNTTGPITQANTLYVQGFQLPYPVSLDYIRLLASFSANSSSAATSATTSLSGTYIQPFCLVIYTLGSGASSNSFMSVGSTSGVLRNSNTITANVNGSQWSSGATYEYFDRGSVLSFTTSAAVTQSRFDYSSAHLSDFTGLRYLDIPFATSLPEGAYWIAFGGNQEAAGNAALRGMSNVFQNVQINRQINSAWNRIATATNSSNLANFGLGSFTIPAANTTTAISTASLPLANISSAASHPYRLFEMVRQA